MTGFCGFVTTSQTGKPVITMQILPTISRSKDDEAMKLGQLMEYSIKNICL